MTTTKELADFAAEVDYEKLEDKTIEEIKKRILDTVGIGINALGEDSVDNVLATVRESGGNSQARLWGTSEHTNLESAAMYNTCLTRYLDFMDSFLAPGETPHPSDNIASIIAVSEYKNSSGKDLIENIGVAYELQGELAWNAPVRDRGWDHVTHTILSQATATGRALGLEGEELQNAIGIAGTSHNSLRVTRTGGINEWKGLVVGNSARNAVYSAKLANNGVEGPKNLFEGQKGWEQIVSGEFEVDLSLGCERVFDTMTKRYVAETYAQSAVEGIIDAAEENDLDARNVESIELTTFHGAKLIIGGGEGDRHKVETKAQADHSLPYMLAVSLIDREMTNRQYEESRINSDDVQSLLRDVNVKEDDELTERFEEGEMPAEITITLENGEEVNVSKDAFSGHPTQPMTWNQVEDKFRKTAKTYYDDKRVEKIIDTVRSIEDHNVGDLVRLLD